MNRRFLAMLADGLMLLGCGVLLIAPGVWNTPAADLLNATHPEWSVPLGICLGAFGAWAILLAIRTFRGLGSQRYYIGSWPLVLILLAAIVTIVLRHFFGGLGGNPLFWWIFAIL